MKLTGILFFYTAISAFFPMGVFMGYIMQYHFAGFVNVNRNMQMILSVSQWWPWVAGSSAAIVTGIFLFAIKIKRQQYRYEHFFFLNLGMLLFFTAGILFMTTTIPYVAIYMSFIAHGLCYIPALSYINIRMGKSRFRFFRLSIPLVFYIFSIAVGATVVYSQINLLILNSSSAPMNDVIGLLLVISSIFTIGCILSLEYNVYYSKLNYKSSLDEDINRENNNFSIFERKYFLISSPHADVVAPVTQSTATNKPTNSITFLLFVVTSKITSIMYFYWPFMFIHHLMSIASLNFDLFSINWFGFTGVIISTIFLIPLTYKLQHFIGMLVKMMYMLLLLIIFSFDNWVTRQITVVMWFLFLALGFAYPNCDINILSFTNLKYTEIVLTIGYVVMNITVGVIQYVTIRTPHLILNLNSTFQLVFGHSLAFLVILFALMVVGMMIMPNRNFKSLLELQNYINTYTIDNLRNNSINVVQMNEREPINIPNTTAMAMAPTFSVYGQPGMMQHNNQMSNHQPYMQVVVQQPPAYTSVLPSEPEQQPPPYLSNSPMMAAGGSTDRAGKK